MGTPGCFPQRENRGQPKATGMGTPTVPPAPGCFSAGEPEESRAEVKAGTQVRCCIPARPRTAAPAPPAPAAPAAPARGGMMVAGEEHPRVLLSPLLQQPCLLLTHFWPASPREVRHLPPPRHSVGFFLSSFSSNRRQITKNPHHVACDTAAPLSFTGTAQPQKNTSFQQTSRAVGALRGPWGCGVLAAPTAPSPAPGLGPGTQGFEGKELLRGWVPPPTGPPGSVPCGLYQAPQTTHPKAVPPVPQRHSPQPRLLPRILRSQCLRWGEKTSELDMFSWERVKKKQKCWLHGRRCHSFPTIN